MNIYDAFHSCQGRRFWVLNICGWMFSAVGASAEGIPPNAIREEHQKKLLISATSRYEPLSSWQKRIVSEEILPLASRYFKSPNQVDDVALRNALQFYAPHYFKTSSSQFLVLFQSDSACGPCNDSQLKTLVQKSLERRGLSVTFLKPDDFTSDSIIEAGNPVDDLLPQVIKKKSAEGGLILQWSAKHSDDSSDDASEKSYSFHSFFQMGSMTFRPDEKEFQENDSFGAFIGKMMSDYWINLGLRTQLEESMTHPEAGKEVVIEVGGIQDFFQYSRVRASLASSIKNISHFEERKLSRGKAVFSLGGDVQIEDIRKQLVDIILDPEGSSHSKNALTVNVR